MPRESPALHARVIERLTNPVLEGTSFRPRSSLDHTCLYYNDRRLGHFGLGRVGNARS